jgi:hypothetical protein
MILTVYIPRLLLANHKQCLVVTLCLNFICSPTISAEAIPADERRFNFIPRPWTLPGELTPEEQAQNALDALKPVIRNVTVSLPDASISSSSNTADVLQISNDTATAPETPVTPNASTTTSNLMTVKALTNAGPTPTQIAYQQKYRELQSLWKTQISGKSLNAGYQVFFEQEDFLSTSSTNPTTTSDDYAPPPIEDSSNQSIAALSSGNLTINALQALMLRYARDEPKIDILTDGLNVTYALIEKTPENSVKVTDALIKSVLLTPAMDAFTKKGRSIYSSIIRLGGEGKGSYINVVIDKLGNVSLIDTAIKHKSYAENLLKAIVTSLNKQRSAGDPTFVAAGTDSIVYTGLQGADDDNTRSGLYAFAYWAAFMQADNLDAYKRVNGAASESTNHLDSYDSLKLCAAYLKKSPTTTGKHDSNPYELDLREWLRSQVKFN